MAERGGRKTAWLQGFGDHLAQPGPTGWCLTQVSSLWSLCPDHSLEEAGHGDCVCMDLCVVIGCDS